MEVSDVMDRSLTTIKLECDASTHRAATNGDQSARPDRGQPRGDFGRSIRANEKVKIRRWLSLIGERALSRRLGLVVSARSR
jgi:hypothetical protein